MRRFLLRSLGLVLASGSTIAVASCASDGDESVAQPPAPSAPAARAAGDSAAARALEIAFAGHADRVLGRQRSDGFVPNERGFSRAPTESFSRHLDLQLPLHAGDDLIVHAPESGEIRVREIGVEGDASLAERAVTYRRAGGTSFWTVTDGGAEEWLHLAAGSVKSYEEAAAAWEIEGAHLVEMNGAVALMDDQGVARGWVTAPEAWSKAGRAVDLRLSTRGNRIELFADARGEEVLVDPGWLAVAPNGTGRFGATLTVLANGKALLANGFTGVTIPNNAELYDPATNTWAAAGNMTAGRYLPGAVLLGNGRVLVVGGQTLIAYTNTAEQYNPATNTWGAAASMVTSRGLVNVALLGSGKVLAAGGYNGASFVASAEQYDPATNTWAAAGTMATIRGLSATVRLNSGKVLVAGGENGAINTPTALASAELYDPATNTWSSAGTMANARFQAHATLLPNGTVVVAGGGTTAGGTLAAVDIYDPATNSWSTGPAMATARAAGSGVFLGSGQFLVAGGASGPAGALTAVASSEAYNPATNSWTSTGNMNAARAYAASAAIAGGDALVVDGTQTGSSAITNVDRYYFSSLAAGSACGLAQQCASGFCVNGVCCQVAACAAQDSCHNAGTCQAGTGTCSNPAKADNTPCNDNNACSQTDSCQAGTCTGANPIICSALDQCHDVGVCNPANGVCSNPNKSDGSACNDNDACTQSDTCTAGACVGANPVTCMALDQCHDPGTCSPATGMCSNPTKADNAPCDDGSECTQTDTCQSGACMGSNPVVCTAQDQCHDAGVCDPANGTCSNPNKADGASCDDGDLCTQTDTCTAGACTGGNAVVCTALDQCHDVGTCDPATGMCDDPEMSDGKACDDGDACTLMDTCQAGACTNADVVTCSASDECHDAGTCDSATGTCDNPAKPDGTACTDGTCQSGTCTPNGTGGTGGGGGTGTGGSGTGGSGGSGASGGSGGSGAGNTGGTGTGATNAGGSNETGGGSGNVAASGGCGCRVAGSESEGTVPSAALAGLALAALTWARRRRAARA